MEELKYNKSICFIILSLHNGTTTRKRQIIFLNYKQML